MVRHRRAPALVLLALLAALPPLHVLPVAAQASAALTATLNAVPATAGMNQGVRITYTVPPSASATPGLTTSTIDFGDGATIDGGSVGPGEAIIGNVVHAYAAPGTYTIILSAQAPDGEIASTTATITVVDRLQPPAIQLQGPSASVAPGDSVSFSYSVTPASATGLAAMAIDYGDGSTDMLTAPSGTISHTYGAAGVYAVLIAATDTSGQTGAASILVQVGS